MLPNNTSDWSECRAGNQTEHHARQHQISDESMSFLNGIDGVTKVLSFLVHIGYFFVVYYVRDFRHRSVLYVHHINLLGLVFSFIYVCWFSKTRLDYSDPALNDVLCTMTEIAWALIKCMRAYSPLLLAVYRALAVFRNDLFKIWAGSYAWLALGLVINWLIVLALILTAKYSFNTSYGSVYCYDGYSKVKKDAVDYFLFIAVAGIIIPNMIVIGIYIVTLRNLRSLENKVTNVPQKHLDPVQTRRIIIKKLAKKNTVNSITLDQTPKAHTSDHVKRIRQLFWVNFFLVISSLGFLFLNAANIFQEFASIWRDYRVLMRVLTEIAQSTVPIVTICYHPKFYNKLKRLVLWYSKKIFPISPKDSQNNNNIH